MFELVRKMQEQWYDVYRWFQVLGVLPVCVLGVVGNSVSVWAWKFCQKPSAVVLLFQCLGFVDSFYLVMAAVYSVLCYLNDRRIAVLILLGFLQILSVHVTLVIGVCRWMAVTKPLLTHRIKPRHVLLTCGGLMLWSGSLVTPVIVSMEMEELFDKGDLLVMDVVLLVMGFVLPTAVLVGFSVSLLRITFGLQRQPRNIRRMTTAVLMISGCSVLACAMEVAGRVIEEISPIYGRDGCNWACVFITFAFNSLLHALNSSVNFFFYFFIASRFRPLLRQSFSCCMDRRRLIGRQMSSASSGSSKLTAESVTDGSCSNTLPRRGRQQLAEEPSVELVESQLDRSEDCLPELDTSA